MIKQWHALLAVILTPYFFYFITPEGNRGLAVIGATMAIFAMGLSLLIALHKGFRDSINKELEK